MAVTLALLAAGCRASDDGLAAPVALAEAAAGADPENKTGPDPDPRDGRDASDAAAAAADAGAPAVPTGVPPSDYDLPLQAWDQPALVGCADGTREGFLDRTRAPAVAGCAGGFRVRGLGPASLAPRCAREAGNTGRNPRGDGCSVADLCAAGWHVCADAAELVARGPTTGCADAVPTGYDLFFLVRAGATATGICAPMVAYDNDLHGCGSLGEPPHPSCMPLDRRLTFAGCLATGGAWACGTASDHLAETSVVSKPSPRGGGVLCCRD